MKQTLNNREGNFWSGVGNGPVSESVLPMRAMPRGGDMGHWLGQGANLPMQRPLGSPFSFGSPAAAAPNLQDILRAHALQPQAMTGMPNWTFPR